MQCLSLGGVLIVLVRIFASDNCFKFDNCAFPGSLENIREEPEVFYFLLIYMNV